MSFRGKTSQSIAVWFYHGVAEKLADLGRLELFWSHWTSNSPASGIQERAQAISVGGLGPWLGQEPFRECRLH